MYLKPLDPLDLPMFPIAGEDDGFRFVLRIIGVSLSDVQKGDLIRWASEWDGVDAEDSWDLGPPTHLRYINRIEVGEEVVTFYFEEGAPVETTRFMDSGKEASWVVWRFQGDVWQEAAS